MTLVLRSLVHILISELVLNALRHGLRLYLGGANA